MYCDPTSAFFDPFVNANPKVEQPPVQSEDKIKPSKETGNKRFNPAAKPFNPNITMTETEQVEEVGQWQIVAAEFGGKAVAVLVVPGTDQVHVCTSPAFNSKCAHPGLSCLVWDSVVFDPETRETSLASQSPLPLDSFVDSGYENMTDNSSEVSGDNIHLQHGLLTTVEYGYHQPELVYQGDQTYYPAVEVFTPRDGFEQQSLLSPTSPLVQYVPWVTQDVPSPVSWSNGLGTEMSNVTSALTNLELGSEGSTDQGNHEKDIKQVVSTNKPVEIAEDEAKIKESFKNQVLSNLKESEEVKDYEDKKIRRDFKKQVDSKLKQGN